jgi:hypothetical protein
VEEAEGFKALHEQYGVSVEELAAKTGKSVAFVRNRLKLCSLHTMAKEAFFTNAINADSRPDNRRSANSTFAGN